eukprot:scaffold2418_cov175-Amphora_coffeaeformis.AAC.12
MTGGLRASSARQHVRSIMGSGKRGTMAQSVRVQKARDNMHSAGYGSTSTGMEVGSNGCLIELFKTKKNLRSVDTRFWCTSSIIGLSFQRITKVRASRGKRTGSNCEPPAKKKRVGAGEQ